MIRKVLKVYLKDPGSNGRIVPPKEFFVDEVEFGFKSISMFSFFIVTKPLLGNSGQPEDALFCIPVENLLFYEVVNRVTGGSDGST